jgi:hypothetical protein
MKNGRLWTPKFWGERESIFNYFPKYIKDHVKSILRRLTFQWSGPDRWNVINILYLLNFLELNL